MSPFQTNHPRVMTKPKPPSQNGNLEYIQKRAIVKHKDNNPKLSLSALAKWATTEFNLARTVDKSMISHILDKREKYLSIAPQDEKIRHTHVVTNDILERVLSTWVLQMEAQRLNISVEIIHEKGRKFAQALGLHECSLFNFQNADNDIRLSSVYKKLGISIL